MHEQPTQQNAVYEQVILRRCIKELFRLQENSPPYNAIHVPLRFPVVYSQLSTNAEDKHSIRPIHIRGLSTSESSHKQTHQLRGGMMETACPPIFYSAYTHWEIPNNTNIFKYLISVLFFGQNTHACRNNGFRFSKRSKKFVRGGFFTRDNVM